MRCNTVSYLSKQKPKIGVGLLRTWAPIGETPIVRVTGARFGFNIISAVSPRGEMRFMVDEGYIGAALFCEFLRRLMYNTKRVITQSRLTMSRRNFDKGGFTSKRKSANERPEMN